MTMKVGYFRVCGTSEDYSNRLCLGSVVEADDQIYGGVVLSKSIGDMMQVMFLCRA